MKLFFYFIFYENYVIYNIIFKLLNNGYFETFSPSFSLKHVTEIILRKRREMEDNECQITPLIDSLVLIDRNVDLLTPLLSQLTYEGLIDERMTIENSKKFIVFHSCFVP